MGADTEALSDGRTAAQALPKGRGEGLGNAAKAGAVRVTEPLVGEGAQTQASSVHFSAAERRVMDRSAWARASETATDVGRAREAAALPAADGATVTARSSEASELELRRLGLMQGAGREIGKEGLLNGTQGAERGSGLLEGRGGLAQQGGGRDRERRRDEARRDVEVGAAGAQRGEAAGKAPVVQLRAGAQAAFNRIIEQIEKLEMAQRYTRIQLKVDLEAGQQMKVILRYNGGHLSTVFMTDSDGFRAAVREGWEQFQRQLLERGVTAELPHFRDGQTGGQRGGQRDAEGWREGGVEDMLGLLGDRRAGTAAAASGGVAREQPLVPATDSRHLSRYA